MTDAVDEEGNEGGEYGLVMPFIVCKPEGPYDGESFVAGVTLGALDERLRIAKPWGLDVETYVPPALIPQLDLVAMRHGYKLTHEPWEEFPDEWTLATFDHRVERPDND